MSVLDWLRIRFTTPPVAMTVDQSVDELSVEGDEPESLGDKESAS